MYSSWTTNRKYQIKSHVLIIFTTISLLTTHSLVEKCINIRREVNPKYYVCAFIGILSLQFILTIFPDLNLMLDISDIHIELQDLVVVVLGVLLTMEYGIAAVSMVSWLHYFQRNTPQNIMKESFKLRCRNARVMTTTVLSVSIAGWMFAFVRRTWTGHLCYVIQVLHLVPSSCVILQTLFSGKLICKDGWIL